MRTVLPAIAWPIRELQAKTLGFRAGELVVVTAGTSVGKSTFLRQAAVDIAMAGHRVGYLSLEDGLKKTMRDCASYLAGRAFHLTGGEEPVEEEVRVVRESGILDRMEFFDDADLETASVLGRMEYMARGLDCAVLVLDHLSFLLYGEKELSHVEHAIKALAKLARTHKVRVLTACHLRKSVASEEGKSRSFEEGRPISLDDILGSGALKQCAATVIALQRDQRDASDRTAVRVLKCRETGRLGDAGSLVWDESAYALRDVSELEEALDA